MPRVDPAAFKDAIVFVGVTAAGLHDVFVAPRRPARSPARRSRDRDDQLLTHTVLVKAPTWARTIPTAVLALAVAFLTVLLPMQEARVDPRARRRRPHVRPGLPRRHVGAARARPPRYCDRLGRGPGVAVFRRGPRQAAGHAALLALRVEGHLRSGARQPGAGRAWRPAPDDERAVLGHARVHGDDRARRSRSPRRAAQRVLLAHGRGRVREPAGPSTSSSATG